MTMLAIDPGTTESGWVIYDGERVLSAGVLPNDEMLLRVQNSTEDRIAIEMIASYGMAVGKEVFETCVWIGRFKQAWKKPNAVLLIFRQAVKLHLCQTTRAKDANIRQALIDMLGPPGTKSNPGPTYGVRGHMWSALAVAVTAWKIRRTA